jgi:hypothetical protein
LTAIAAFGAVFLWENSMKISEFQSWLNKRGANIKVDGQAGPATRAAIMQVFTNKNAAAITPAQIEDIAKKLGVSGRQLRAVSKVESGGGGWNDQGQPKILWERHYFWRRIQTIIPWISNPKGGDYTLDANKNGVNDSWEKLCLAACRNPIAAFESASWGKFQIMGAHAKALGYENALEFAYSMVGNERAHYSALAAFVRVNGLVPAMKALSTNPETCRAFARRYNGSAYEKFSYHVKLAGAMR